MNRPEAMPNTPQTDETERLQRNAQRIGWATLIVAALLLVYGVYTLFLRQEWTSVLFLVFYIALGLGGWAELWFARRNKVDTGSLILISITLVLILVIGAWLKDQGVLFFIISFAMISTISALALSARYRTVGIVAGIAAGLAVLFFDMFVDAPWRREAFSTLAAVSVSGAIVFIYIIVLLFQFRNFSLRSKLIVSFMVVTLLPLVILAYINDSTSRETLTANAQQALLSAASQTAAQIDNFIDERTDAIRAEAQNTTLIEYLGLPPEQRAGSPDEDRVNRFLFARLAQDPVYITSVAVCDINGNTLLDTFTSDVGVNKADRSWFKNALASGLPYASDVEFDQDTGAASIYFSAPVRNTQGEITGVIRVRYDAAIIQAFATDNRNLVGPGSFAVIVKVNNHLRLGHGSRADLVAKTVTPLTAATLGLLQNSRLMPPGEVEDVSTNLPDFASGLNNSDVQALFTAHLIAAESTLEQVAMVRTQTQDWRVVYAQAQEQFLAPIEIQQRNNVLLTLVMALVVAGVAAVVAQLLSNPLVQLTQVAAKIAAGDVNVLAKVETRDELGQLALTFNQMTQQLRDFITSLEARVAARTRDLATVAEVGTVTSTILETRRLLQEVVDLTKERFNLYHSHIYLLDETSENLVLTAGAGGVGRIMTSEKRSIPVSREQSLVARAAREKRGVVVNDVTLAPDFLPNPLLPDTRSELAVPMMIGNVVIGVFDIQSDLVGRFSDSDVSIQTTLAAQIATSIQNARLFEESQSKAELETTINTISQKIQRASSIEETLRIAAQELGVTLRAKRVSARIGMSTEKIMDAETLTNETELVAPGSSSEQPLAGVAQ